MLDTVHSLLALGAIALSAWGVGRPLVRWLRIAHDDRLAAIVWSFAIGLVIAGQGLTIWGLLGGLSAPAIRCATMASAALGAIEILRTLARSSVFDVRRWTLDVRRFPSKGKSSHPLREALQARRPRVLHSKASTARRLPSRSS
jgi:hypothetical protein